MARDSFPRMAEALRGRLEPDDVLQEAFLAAHQRLGHYAAGLLNRQ